MLNNLGIAIQITAIGMGLVFGAILLLWGVMSLLMRLTSRGATQGITPLEDTVELDLRRRAAASAVALALEGEKAGQVHEFPLPPTPLVTAWQAVMRSKMLNKRGPVR